MRAFNYVTRTARCMYTGGSTFLSFIGRFAFAFGVLHIIDNYVASTKQARGLSMSPTISESGDVLLYERLSLFLNRFLGVSSPYLRRGEIVLASSPDDNCIICKRVVGIEGDIFLASPPSNNPTQPSSIVVVPKHFVWLQGDNAPMSHDSRNYGLTSIGLIEGRVICKIWPPSFSPFFSLSLSKNLINNFISPTPQAVAAALDS